MQAKTAKQRYKPLLTEAETDNECRQAQVQTIDSSNAHEVGCQPMQRDSVEHSAVH